MSFELVEKVRGASIPKGHLIVSPDYVSFGNDIKKLLKGSYGLEIHIDKENGLIGFKKTEDTKRGFSLSKVITIKLPIRLRNKIPKKTYKVHLKGHMLLIKVPGLKRLK